MGRLADADEFTARARDATGALKAALASADPLRDLAAFGVRRTPPTRGALPLTPAEQAAAQSRLITEATSRAATPTICWRNLCPKRRERLRSATDVACDILDRRLRLQAD